MSAGRPEYPGERSSSGRRTGERARPAPGRTADDFDPEYGPAFFAQLIRDEDARLPLVGYMQYQDEINDPMRTSLVQWLIDIKVEFLLHRQTLSTAINILDRYLSRRRVPRNDFQLLGIVALFVASKYEEVPSRVLTIATLRALCCNIYTPQDIFEMERRLLDVLDFDLSWRGPSTLVDAVVRAGELEEANPRPALYRRDSGIGFDPQLDGSEPVDPGLVSAFSAGPVTPAVAKLSHTLIESALLHSCFSGLRSVSVAVASMLAAEGVLESRGYGDELSCEPLRSRFAPAILADPSIPSMAAALANCGAHRGILPPMTGPPTATP